MFKPTFWLLALVLSSSLAAAGSLLAAPAFGFTCLLYLGTAK